MFLPAGLGALLATASTLMLGLVPPVPAAQFATLTPPPCACTRQPREGNPAAAPDDSPDDNEEIAALEAIRIALSEVGDGSAYVWHRRHGRLGGLVQPTMSFKDAAGLVCRHILLIMSRGDRVGRAEGIACRRSDGRWQLDG